MKIRNIQLRSIEARRYTNLNEHPSKVRIDHNSNIAQVREEKKGEAIIEFQYTASYGPVGMIKLEGSLIYEDDNARKIAIDWKNTRKMPDKIASQIHTAVMHACVPGAVGIAKDLGLPPPIPLPQLRLDAKSKKAEFGPEVA